MSSQFLLRYLMLVNSLPYLDIKNGRLTYCISFKSFQKWIHKFLHKNILIQAVSVSFQSSFTLIILRQHQSSWRNGVHY